MTLHFVIQLYLSLCIVFIPVLFTLQKIDFNSIINQKLAQNNTPFGIQIGYISYDTKKSISSFLIELNNVALVFTDEAADQKHIQVLSKITLEFNLLQFLFSTANLLLEPYEKEQKHNMMSAFEVTFDGVRTTNILYIYKVIHNNAAISADASLKGLDRRIGKKVYSLFRNTSLYHPEITITFADCNLCEALKSISPDGGMHCDDIVEIDAISIKPHITHALDQRISIRKQFLSTIQQNFERTTYNGDHNEMVPLNHFSDIQIRYTFDGNEKIIDGYILQNKEHPTNKIYNYAELYFDLGDKKQKTAIVTDIIEIDNRDAMIGLQLYGHLAPITFYKNQDDQRIVSTTVEKFNSLLMYRYSDATTFWKLNIHDLNLKHTALNADTIHFSDINLDGFYDVGMQYFKVRDFSCDIKDSASNNDILESEPYIISFSGNLDIYRPDYSDDISYISKLYLQLNTHIPQRLIYKYWPNLQSNNVRDEIEHTITNGTIKSANLELEHLINQSGSKMRKIDVSLQIDDVMLKRKIKDSEHHFGAPNAFITADMNSVKVLIPNAMLDNNFKINDVNILVPLDQYGISHYQTAYNKSDKYYENIKWWADNNNKNSLLGTLVSFGFTTQLGSLEQWYNQSFGSDKVQRFRGGDVVTNVKVGIPQIDRRLKFNDLYISIISNVHNLCWQVKSKKHRISSKQLHLEMRNADVNVRGNIIYNDVKINNLNFDGMFASGSIDDAEISFLPKTLHAVVAIQQYPITQYVAQYLSEQLHLDGDVIVDVKSIQKSNSGIVDASFDLKNIILQDDIFGISKDRGTHGLIKVKLKHTKNAIKNTNIDVSIQNFEAIGDITHSDITSYQAKISVKKWGKNSFDLHYINNAEHGVTYNISGDVIDISQMIRISKDLKTSGSNNEAKNQQYAANIDLKKVIFDNRALFDNLKVQLSSSRAYLEKINASAYLADEKGYMRLFFDRPVFAFVVSDIGELMNDVLGHGNLREGALELKGNLEFDKKYNFKGYVSIDNFILWKSYLLSTMLRIYSLSGGSYANMLKLLTSDGVDFHTASCKVNFTSPTLYLNQCAAVSDVMFINADAKFDVGEQSGVVAGMIIPVNFINVVMILIQKIFPSFGNDLLKNNKEKQNFSVTFAKDQKPIIRTNPISFILPGFLGQMFSQKRSTDITSGEPANNN